MINYIWSGMILISVFFAALNGRMAQLSEAVFTGCNQSVQICLTIAGAMCLWGGLMRIADKAGLTGAIGKVLGPFIRFLFPGLDPKGPAARAISMNISANLLGLGNAATPFGLEAMKHLQKENPLQTTASNHMVTFVVLNSASLQIIPTTIAVLRARHGSKSPMDIMPAVWIASLSALVVGITLALILNHHKAKLKNEKNGDALQAAAGKA
ncbi:MAG: hypothetical protein BGN88_06490 [Clostridiales bacterium 43-6]|nr:MAG: hypothetical protein BGN88_06490 [Clostridiales bacterium 43-6]